MLANVTISTRHHGGRTMHLKSITTYCILLYSYLRVWWPDLEYPLCTCESAGCSLNGALLWHKINAGFQCRHVAEVRWLQPVDRHQIIRTFRSTDDRHCLFLHSGVSQTRSVWFTVEKRFIQTGDCVKTNQSIFVFVVCLRSFDFHWVLSPVSGVCCAWPWWPVGNVQFQWMKPV